MQTIILYKVVWIDDYGDMCEHDFQDKDAAIRFYNTLQYAHLYEYRLLGEIKEVIVNGNN